MLNVNQIGEYVEQMANQHLFKHCRRRYSGAAMNNMNSEHTDTYNIITRSKRMDRIGLKAAMYIHYLQEMRLQSLKEFSNMERRYSKC